LTTLVNTNRLTLWGSEMDREHLKILIRDLEFLLQEIKSEVYSDCAAYIDTDVYASHGLSYETLNDDDGSPD
jgi:hypothetical protein